MSLLFAAAGGLIEAQDEALAGALSKAAEEPAGLQSLGLIRAGKSDVFELADRCVMGAYGRVGPEDVSDSPLERIAQCAEALQPSQFSEISERATKVSQALSSAAQQLKGDLNNVLGSGWQGEFAASAQDSVTGLVDSAIALSGELETVATKAERAHDGFVTTRNNIAEQTAQARSAQFIGQEDGPAGVSEVAQSRARLAAAEEQARAIVNTEYSPAVMDANLDDLDFTAAYRVVSTSALGGPNGVDMARIWNTEGIPRPAQPAAPNPAAIAAITGGTGADGGGPGVAGAAGVGVGEGIAGASTPNVPTDAATEQALLAVRAGTADGAGALSPSAGQAGAGGGVNAATTAAGAPFAPMPGANGQQAGAGSGGAGGIRGIRGGAAGGGRGRDRGFGSTAGLLGGGGAAAAGAGASRMGGAGTLAGFGAGGAAGPGGGGLAGGAPGAGSAGPGAAGSGAGGGAFSSSSSSNGAQAGRAGAMPMGGMMGAAGAGQNNDRRGHTPASYLTNATNTTEIIGDPVKVAPAVLGRAPAEDPAATGPDQPEPFRGRVIGRDYTGGGATRQ